ncbi:MAG: hypothetical protein IJX89_04490 [Alphaproteobacteria bacterium]|nr:hypothetical protein [Alphaproteobacteria bacterium]
MPNPNGPLFSAFVHTYFTAEFKALSIGFYAESKGPFSHGPPSLTDGEKYEKIYTFCCCDVVCVAGCCCVGCCG